MTYLYRGFNDIKNLEVVKKRRGVYNNIMLIFIGCFDVRTPRGDVPVKNTVSGGLARNIFYLYNDHMIDKRIEYFRWFMTRKQISSEGENIKRPVSSYKANIIWYNVYTNSTKNFERKFNTK